MRCLVFVGLALLGPSLEAGQIANDWLVVPGRRAGPITAEVTHADLIRVFGHQNVVDEQVEVNDGGPFGTVVYKQYADRQVIVLWRDDKPEEELESLIFCPSRTRSCRWHTRQQIRIGTTLKKLEEMNGGPFMMAGFGFDGSGTVISFRNGALQALQPACGAVRLALNPPDRVASKDFDLIQQVSGHKEFSSRNPAMQAINPPVDSASMDFRFCGERVEPQLARAADARIYTGQRTNKSCERCKKGYANDDCAETGGSLNVR